MATIAVTPRLPLLVPSQKAIGKLPADTVFIALDTESLVSNDMTAEAGLAVLPRLRELPWTIYGEQSPKDFIRNHHLMIYSLKGDPPDSDTEARQPRLGSSKIAKWFHRLKLRCTKRPQINRPRTLRDAFKQTIEKIRDIFPEGHKIALVGFSRFKDFLLLGLQLSDLIGCIDYWITLSQIIVSSPVHHDHKEGTENPLDTFSFQACVSGLDARHRCAGNAVRALAVLDGLMYPRELRSIKMEVSTDVNKFLEAPFRAVIHTYSLPLPPGMDSAQKLAEKSQYYGAIQVAASSDQKFPSIHTTHMTYGCVCFETKKELKRYIKKTHDLEIDGRMLNVTRISPQTWVE
ncbi:hypothetical protein F4781DRAFT_382899 [Annulohypoxylon bovei var. microspora]|nr:hypothetical protein F4781DRAFT_382899 [Annulohypoxylon bovei var. microspora]